MGSLAFGKGLCFWILVAAAVAACGSATPLRADAGPDMSVVVGEAPRFDGCASTGDIVNYSWKIIRAPEDRADDIGKMLREVDASCRFTLESAMVLEEVGDWTIELTVEDEAGATSSDTLTVTVNG